MCMCVCVCVCVCLRPSIVKACYVWGWNSRGEINDVVLKTFLFSVKSLHPFEPFIRATLSCSRTRTGKSHDLTSFNMCVSLSKTWGLHLPLSGIAFGPCYIMSRFAHCDSTHERGRSLTRKG